MRKNFFSIPLLFLMVGCVSIPLGKKTVIPEGVANSPEELIAKVKAIPEGMSCEEAMKRLNINSKTQNVRPILDNSEKQKILFGDVRPTNPEELKLNKTKLSEISFQIRVRLWHPDYLVSWRNIEKGPNLKVYIVCVDGKWTKRPDLLPDTYYYKNVKRGYIWDFLGRFFGGFTSKGGSEAAKAAF